MELITDPLAHTFFVRAVIAAILVGTVCAVVGTYVVLKGLAFIGEAVSHASFPGLVAAFVLGLPYMVGAGIAAVGTAVGIGVVIRRTRIRSDTAIGVIFVGMFALGLFWYSSISGFVTDLFSFLFGNILSISETDLISLSALGLVILLIVLVLWKELLYATFDPLAAAASGLPVGLLEYLFLVLVALTIVVSLQAVGIILVVAMLVTPAATAQLLSVRFGRLMILAVAIGVGGAVVGLYASFWLDAASGATIVLIETAAFLTALLLGPRTGLVARWRRGSQTA
jgi:ABC-type Mn2+/Zn2+ transport system permease subunit